MLNKDMSLRKKFHEQGDHRISMHLVGAASASGILKGKHWRKYAPGLALSRFKPSTGITS